MTVPGLTLSAAEIDELCKPLVRRSAQLRYLKRFLGLSDITQRPDGLPQVSRKLAEEKIYGAQAPSSEGGGGLPTWSK